MRKVNTNDIAEEAWSSPKGKFGGASKEISVALGRQPQSTDLKERHPCGVGGRAQWEFYHVMSGAGLVRHQEGTTPIEAGDAFLFEPGQPHQLINDGSSDLVLYVVADNPIGESAHYPDTGKWLVRSPEHRVLRSDAQDHDYYDGEE